MIKARTEGEGLYRLATILQGFKRTFKNVQANLRVSQSTQYFCYKGILSFNLNIRPIYMYLHTGLPFQSAMAQSVANQTLGRTPFLVYFVLVYVLYTTHRTYGLTSHPKDKAIMVKLSCSRTQASRPGLKPTDQRHQSLC